MPGQPFSVIVDARGTGGLGDVIVDIVHDKQSIPYKIEEISAMQYRVSFLPREAGKYRIYVYFNGSDVRGSPFSLRVGTQKGSRRSRDSTSSLERTKMSSLERRMNGIGVSKAERSSPVPKSHSPSYKSPSPTQSGGFRDFHVKNEARTQSPVLHQSLNSSTPLSYKTTSNLTKEISNSMYQTSSSINRARSPNPSPNSTLRNLHSPLLIKEAKEIYSTSSMNRSRSPNLNLATAGSRNLQSPSFIKESKDAHTFNSVTRSRSPNPANHTASTHNVHGSSIIKESKEIYQSNSLNRSRSPNLSPMAFGNRTQSPVNRSFSPRNDREVYGNRRGSADNSVNIDTTSNVRGNN